MPREKLVYPVSDATKQAIVDASVQVIPARPVMSAAALQKLFVTPVVNAEGKACAIAEISRIAAETEAALNELYALLYLLKGEKGDKGDPGTGISNITIAEGTVAADGGQNYTMTLTKTDNTTVQLTFKAPKGNAGTDGAPGAAATVTVGSVTTGQPGTEAVVTNGGTSAAAVLNFTIPRGATGAKGDPGEKGDPGQTGANGKTPTMSINSNGELIATFED